MPVAFPSIRLGIIVSRMIRLMTLAPGHFHAALVQKQMLHGVYPRSYVYAPLDDDLAVHLARIAGFNARPDNPTAWELDVRAGANYLERFLREQPGNAVVIAGRNRPKIDLILAAVSNGLCVLADKPWVIRPEDFPKLERVFAEADLREAFAWDMMTERFEIASILQRELIRDPDVFGTWTTGSPDKPALCLESVHYLKKTVAGVPLRRPAWWFDVEVAGEALADVGTHLADLALWFISSETPNPIDYRQDVRVIDACTWPTPLTQEQFGVLTGLPALPPELMVQAGEHYLYRGNGTTNVQIRGIHTRLTTLWDYEAEPGRADSHEAVAIGTEARVGIRSNANDGSRSVLFVAANDPAGHPDVVDAMKHWCDDWQDHYPGLVVDDAGCEVVIRIPKALQTGHEEHFAAVFAEYRHYFANPKLIPKWERANLLAKYFITTRAVELARCR